MLNGEYKNIMKKIMMIIMAVVLMALPTMAQQQQWQSTSAMQGTGSSLAPQVTPVGATSVGEMATTTSSPSNVVGRPRKVIEDNSDPGQLDEGSPIGDAILPLIAFALMFCGYIAIRRKRVKELKPAR